MASIYDVYEFYLEPHDLQGRSHVVTIESAARREVYSAIKRANEASLIQDEDVEMEEIRTVGGKKDEPKRTPQDRGLQRAGDLLRGLRKIPPARRAAFDPCLFRGHI